MRAGRARSFLLMLGLFGAGLVPASLSQSVAIAADAFVVDSQSDAVDAVPGDGVCASLQNECTLRAAVQEANALVGPDTVVLSGATYVLTIAGQDEDSSATGDLDVLDDLVVRGEGPGTAVLDAGAVDRMFHVPNAGVELAIEHVTITGGDFGAILSSGDLELFDVIVRDNIAGSFVGVVENQGGTLSILDSEFVDNRGDFGAIRSVEGELVVLRTLVARNGKGQGNVGAIDSYASVTLIEDSLIVGNGPDPTHPAPYGNEVGGIANRGPGFMMISRSTIADNEGRSVGGIQNSTDLAMGPVVPHGLIIENSTVAGNTMNPEYPYGAGGVYAKTGPVEIRNSTIVGNAARVGGGVYKEVGTPVAISNTAIWGNVAADGPDCFGTLQSDDYNLIGELADCALIGETANNLIGVDPQLSALDYYGGWTPVLTPMKGSPLIDAGNPSISPTGESCRPTDQRGVERPYGDRCDIGAVEYTPPPAPPVGLVDPASGEWHLRNEIGIVTSFFYGNPGDMPFLGDWDCDGEATPGLFRQSDAFAYLRNSNTQGIADIRFYFGNPSDIPLAGDFNGDGCDTLSIYRPSEARFYIINKLGENEGGLGAAEYSFLFGNPGDKPVVGDWDGDGIDEIGLHRETSGFFYYRNTLTTGIADGQFYFGDPGDRFVAGDWGVVDGVETPGLYRPSNSTFYFRHTLTQGNADSQFVWTGAGMNWLPVSGDFTLD